MPSRVLGPGLTIFAGVRYTTEDCKLLQAAGLLHSLWRFAAIAVSPWIAESGLNCQRLFWSIRAMNPDYESTTSIVNAYR